MQRYMQPLLKLECDGWGLKGAWAAWRNLKWKQNWKTAGLGFEELSSNPAPGDHFHFDHFGSMLAIK